MRASLKFYSIVFNTTNNMPSLLRRYTRKLLMPKKLKKVPKQEYMEYIKSIDPNRCSQERVLYIAYQNYIHLSKRDNITPLNSKEFCDYFKNTQHFQMLMGVWAEHDFHNQFMPVLCVLNKRGKREITNFTFKSKNIPPRRQFGVSNGYRRKAIYNNPLEILHQLNTARENNVPVLKFKGVMVKSSSLRYRLFEQNLRCVKCGVKGAFLALEKSASQDCRYWHFNLYGIDENGNEVMLTKDHIMPKSKGGKDRLENMQTMCSYCNSVKGNKETIKYEIKEEEHEWCVA